MQNAPAPDNAFAVRINADGDIGAPEDANVEPMFNIEDIMVERPADEEEWVQGAARAIRNGPIWNVKCLDIKPTIIIWER